MYKSNQAETLSTQLSKSQQQETSLRKEAEHLQSRIAFLAQTPNYQYELILKIAGLTSSIESLRAQIRNREVEQRHSSLLILR